MEWINNLLKSKDQSLYQSSLQSSIFLQVLFWTSLFFTLIWIDKDNTDMVFVISNEIVNVLSYIFLVNFNLYFLIPKYLKEGRYTAYLLYSVVVVILFTSLKINILYIKLYNHPIEQYNLMEQQVWYYLINAIVVAISTVIHMSAAWVVDQKLKSDLLTYGMESELKFLRSQINPHFLFNTLNNIYALSLKKSELAPTSILKLSEMMMYMLYECNEEKVLLTKEIEALKNYTALEKLRMKEQFVIKSIFDGNFESIKIAPLILMAFLENSFKHGGPDKFGDGFIDMTLNTTVEGKLNFRIANSIPSFDQMVKVSKGGIGLENVSRRLQLIYPNRHQLSVSHEKETFVINLEINLI